MRFRKRVKIFPGFHLNFSNSGISSSIGVKGASITFGKKGTYLNTSIPGTGLYNRQRIGGSTNANSNNELTPNYNIPEINEQETDRPGTIKSVDKDTVTSSTLLEMRETIKEAFQDKIEIKGEIFKTEKELKTAKVIRLITSILIIGLFLKYFKNKVTEKEEYITDLNNQLSNCKVDIDINLDSDFANKYKSLNAAFEKLIKSEIIWDVTSQVRHDSVANRSAASAAITRRRVNFNFDNIDVIKSSFTAFHLENANGDDLFIYPAFIVVTKNKSEFGLIDLNEMEIEFVTTKFLEEERIPNDTKKVDETWAKVNKNGQPDKRFKGNYKIPIVEYGTINLKSKTGLNESYCISNHQSSKEFVDNLLVYQKSIS